MPSKYVVRDFSENSYYHVFNQGVGKQEIFLDDKDYNFFQVYLTIYLSPIESVMKKYPDLPRRLRSKNLAAEVELLAYCLMPDHFHLLLKQRSIDGVSKLMKQMTNAYTLFFNEKNERVGGLMQGRYKAARVEDATMLPSLMRYIHLNPITSGLTHDLRRYQWSSYRDYIQNEADLVATKEILVNFNIIEDFENFHSEQESRPRELEKVKIE